MIGGDKSKFAIESGITHAYARPSLRALGFFVIHLGGVRYGVTSPDATMLACSFDEVGNRLVRRGLHTASFSASSADEISNAFRRAFYESKQSNQQFFGLSQTEFRNTVDSNHLVWAPDGDEAFDDGSYVLQFDVENRVRLIGFKSDDTDRYDPATLKDIWLSSDDFYSVLSRWRDAFEAEWETAPKIRDDTPFKKGGQ